MRKIVAAEFMSLDGVIEAPEKWHFPFMSDDMQQDVMEQIFASEGALFGRVTYEEFASFWPSQTDDPSGLAGKLNSQPKYVLSTTLKKADWNNSTILNSTEALAKLKQQSGGTIAITGSAALVQSLTKAGLIDEYRLYIHPIIVGKGKRLFKDGMDMATLKLVETKTFNAGVVLMIYQPAPGTNEQTPAAELSSNNAR